MSANKLRECLKEEIKASDKGGEPEQWSARKAQLLKQEYERQGGGYRGGKEEKDEKQRSLSEWSQEEWRTRDGSPTARNPETGETSRYLPKEAWEKMSRKEAEETDREKRIESRRGRQFVDNTQPAKEAREESLAPPLAGYDGLSVREVERKIESLSEPLSEPEISRVREYERRHKARKTLLEYLNRKLVD